MICKIRQFTCQIVRFLLQRLKSLVHQTMHRLKKKKGAPNFGTPSFNRLTKFY
jgi:hypothetical protein